MGLVDLVTEKGPTMLDSTLHGVVILMKKDWDWFINLSSSYYPLMPQDGITLLNLKPFPDISASCLDAVRKSLDFSLVMISSMKT